MKIKIIGRVFFLASLLLIPEKSNALGFFKKVGKDIEKGTKKVVKKTEQVGKKVVKETKKAPKTVARETKKVADTAIRETQKGIQTIAAKTVTGTVGPKGIEFVPNIKLSNERAIVQTFAPLVKLSSGEKYFPSSIEWYLQRVALKNPNGKVVVAMGKVTPEDLEKYDGKGYYLDPEGKESTYEGQKPTQGQIVAPCYVNYKYEPGASTAIMRVFFFYPYNEPTPVLQAGKLLEALDITTAGSHEGDIEQVDIYLTQKGNGVESTKVLFYRHGKKHSKFDKFGRDGTHPVVYAGKYGHGSYGHTIPIVNDLGDTADGKGAQWQCWKHYEIMKDQPWLEFGDKIGTDRKQNPRSKGFTPAVPGFKKRLLK